ncbi:hypothetical protein [Streptomyces sp. NBC_01483]|uniref:hypothetical protein n=1 Tax=Streptomyces sp. NBC_01483 TaxID=2903883 RepID=UPI002E2F0F1A|nr:hypothetical protein [Streptomyces sp. NBC_01483]
MGKVVSPTNTVTGHLGFQSGWTEPGSGDVGTASRWYNPDTGQFLNRDRTTKNYVSARLKDGTIITGRSMGKGRAGIHAEEDLINQAGGVENIDAVFTARAPCDNKCDGLLRDTDVDVSCALPWNHPDAAVRKATRPDQLTSTSHTPGKLTGRKTSP